MADEGEGSVSTTRAVEDFKVAETAKMEDEDWVDL